jgi:hypothetical protein
MATCQRATSARFHPIAACIPARGPPLRTAPTGAKRKPTVTQPHKRVRRRPIPVVRFAKRSAKRLGSEAPRAWKPAMRSGLGLMLMGLLASARQQIAQGWQGNPSSQAVDERRGPHPGQLKTAPMMPDIAAANKPVLGETRARARPSPGDCWIAKAPRGSARRCERRRRWRRVPMRAEDHECEAAYSNRFRPCGK